MKSYIIAVALALPLFSCQKETEEVKPKVNYLASARVGVDCSRFIIPGACTDEYYSTFATTIQLNVSQSQIAFEEYKAQRFFFTKQRYFDRYMSNCYQVRDALFAFNNTFSVLYSQVRNVNSATTVSADENINLQLIYNSLNNIRFQLQIHSVNLQTAIIQVSESRQIPLIQLRIQTIQKSEEVLNAMAYIKALGKF